MRNLISFCDDDFNVENFIIMINVIGRRRKRPAILKVRGGESYRRRASWGAISFNKINSFIMGFSRTPLTDCGCCANCAAKSSRPPDGGTGQHRGEAPQFNSI